MVTVEKLLRIPKLRNITVAAGKSGLTRKVGNVTVMEVPDIIQWLKSDDFVITSLYAVKDDIGAQCRLLDDLSHTSCACVAVKIGQYVKELSAEVKAMADKHGLPLLIIPYDLSYIDIIMNAMNCIFEEQNPRVVLEKYIKDIIFEAYTEPALMVERGTLLGLMVEKDQYVAMTIQFDDAYSPSEADIQALWHVGISIAQFLTTQRGLHFCIAVKMQSNCSILLDAEDEQTIARLLPFIQQEALLQLDYAFPAHRIYIGFGNAYNGLSGIRNTYFESIRAIRTGQIFTPDNRIQNFRDIELQSIIAEAVSGRAISLLDRILNKIDNKEVLETLIMYYECNANYDETAAKLFAHKNTIKYRLQKVKDLTGLDVKNPIDSFNLYVAVLAYKMRKHSHQ